MLTVNSHNRDSELEVRNDNLRLSPQQELVAQKDSSSLVTKDNDNTDGNNGGKSTKATTKLNLGVDSNQIAQYMDDEMDKTVHFNKDDSKSNMIPEQYRTL